MNLIDVELNSESCDRFKMLDLINLYTVLWIGFPEIFSLLRALPFSAGKN